MTVALPLAWTALVLGGVAFTYTLLRDIVDGRRIDDLEKLADGLRGDITEILRDHRRNLAAIHARIDSLRVPEVGEPVTRPQPVVRGVPTDTRPQAAVIDAGLAELVPQVATTTRVLAGRTFTFRAES